MADDLPIRDARRIRGLSHPLRLQLLDLLAEGPRTATQCATVTGESPASCSFHLRTLAKYGFVEPMEHRGRQRPWKLAESSMVEVRPDYDDPTSIGAVDALARVVVDQATDEVRAWLDAARAEPAEWLEASVISRSPFWATVEELAEVSGVVEHLIDRFRDREGDPSLRPAGARPARLFAVASPDVAREQRLAAEDEARS